ncbi:MAG: hypothetical protein ACI81P_002348 [Neolewinella sp.]|jgi:hypothetical protein
MKAGKYSVEGVPTRKIWSEMMVLRARVGTPVTDHCI